MKMTRPVNDVYFLRIAKDVSTRGTCNRKQVGYVVVKDNRIIATGYNGSIAGLEHCDEVGHLMDNNHCIRTIHAEINSILQAAKFGQSVDGATMYGTWGPPCWNCFKEIANAGIKQIIYLETTDERHKKTLVEETAAKAGINLYWWGKDNELD